MLIVRSTKKNFMLIISALVGSSIITPAGAQGYKVLYTFCKAGGTCSDGQNPRGGLVADSRENLYGTTFGGGAHQHGVAYELKRISSHRYKYRVIYDFGLMQDDPANPSGPMFFDTKGNLYGSTAFGGASGLGTIFKLRPNKNPKKKWSAQTIYDFCPGRPSGCAATPIDGVTYTGAAAGSLYDGNSPLYGVTWTWNGESLGAPGTAFAFQPGSGFQIIHTFGGPHGTADGSQPLARLTEDTAGNLYGSTVAGGTSIAAGTAFKLAPSGSGWTESLLHVFCKKETPTCADGNSPQGGVTVDSKGNVYGTTYYGGQVCSVQAASGCGVIFELKPRMDGSKETVRYKFCNLPGCTDGADPAAALLIGDHGNIFGTTLHGGNEINGGGTLFQFDGSALTTLYEFCQQTDCADGLSPTQDLIRDSKGIIFGTTMSGGAGAGQTSSGNGVVYEYVP